MLANKSICGKKLYQKPKKKTKIVYEFVNKYKAQPVSGNSTYTDQTNTQKNGRKHKNIKYIRLRTDWHESNI